MSQLLLLNGPNLNLLGTRETSIYGQDTLTDIESLASATAHELGHSLTSFQSNSESELIERIHQSLSNTLDFILINAGALTHTSIALRDALAASQTPFIELHISNTYARESFRQHSYLADLAHGVITGFGKYSYVLAIQAAHHILQQN